MLWTIVVTLPILWLPEVGHPIAAAPSPTVGNSELDIARPMVGDVQQCRSVHDSQRTEVSHENL